MINPQEITRHVYWNIPLVFKVLVYLGGLGTIALVAWAIYQRTRLWKKGKEDNRRDNLKERLLFATKNVFLHTRILKDEYPGIMHLTIFWAFLVLLLGTIIVAIEADVPFVHFYYGGFYLLVSLLLDVAGLVLIVGICMALYRRLKDKPDRLQPQKAEDSIILYLLLAVAVTGFLTEAVRIVAQGFPGFEVYSFVGFILAIPLKILGINGTTAHRIFWFIHLLCSFTFIAYIGYSKLLHILVTPANIVFRDPRPYGLVDPIPNMEEAESFGLTKIEEFSWKQLMDLDACMRCGRCQDACPAHNTDKPLSPKNLIQDLKEHMNDRLVNGKDSEECTPYEKISDDVIWSCTTCGACMEECPAYIEHLDKIVEMRRYLSLMEGRIPEELNQTFRNLENNYNPWGIGFADRADWAEGLDIPLLSESQDVEYLLWVGCAGAYDDRYKRVMKDLVFILKSANVSFAILGVEEKCCGDSARRLGNEYLFEMLATEVAELLNSYGVKRIITACPHGYHTFKHEYSQYGWSGEVWHHSQFISKLIREGKVKFNIALPHKTIYHDSCYLGRHNGIYDEPRFILRNLIPEEQLQEMDRNRERSFCCGAGGGRMWMEEKIGERINIVRCQEALQKNPDKIVTACPFCLTMLEDGVKDAGKEEEVAVRDIAELVARAIELPQPEV